MYLYQSWWHPCQAWDVDLFLQSHCCTPEYLPWTIRFHLWLFHVVSKISEKYSQGVFRNLVRPECQCPYWSMLFAIFCHVLCQECHLCHPCYPAAMPASWYMECQAEELPTPRTPRDGTPHAPHDPRFKQNQRSSPAWVWSLACVTCNVTCHLWHLVTMTWRQVRLALQILFGLVRKFGNIHSQFCDPYHFVLTGPWTLACKADSMDKAIFLLAMPQAASSRRHKLKC